MSVLRSLLLICIFLCSIQTYAQKGVFETQETKIASKKDTIYGTLIQPFSKQKIPLMIIIPGSGPTDRNGNNSMMKNNSLKYLAESLAAQRIASYRYDKSTAVINKKKISKEKTILFSDFIENAIAVIRYFKKMNMYSKIIIAGHSQGSLVGMIASQNRVDAYISIAGAGRTIDKILKEQLEKQAPAWKEDISKTLTLLKEGEIDKDYNKLFYAIFRESVQPFLISWIRYNPQEEIKKLKIPVLIINGTQDIQVPTSDAYLLQKANSNSKINIIKNMNHIFKEVTGDRSANIATYNNAELPIMKKLITSISSFIKAL